MRPIAVRGSPNLFSTSRKTEMPTAPGRYAFAIATAIRSLGVDYFTRGQKSVLASIDSARAWDQENRDKLAAAPSTLKMHTLFFWAARRGPPWGRPARSG